jgi:HK97 gp10 family phage protein
MIKVRNGKDFKRAMTQIALKVEKRMGIQINQKLALDAFTNIVRRSPVLKGYLRHNWDVSIDVKPVEKKLKPEKGKTYSEPDKPILKSIKWNSIIIIYNNTIYAVYIENGTEKMEAQPMVSPTEIEMQKVAEDLCKALSIEKFND